MILIIEPQSWPLTLAEQRVANFAPRLIASSWQSKDDMDQSDLDERFQKFDFQRTYHLNDFLNFNSN